MDDPTKDYQLTLTSRIARAEREHARREIERERD